MDLTKNGIKGIGVLTLLGVLCASGFLVAKPQVEQALDLMSQTEEVKTSTEMRELRLAKLQGESSNLAALTDEVNDLLVKIPSEKNVTDIAEAAIEAMPPGVQLVSFSHGELEDSGPVFEVPEAFLESAPEPFELVAPGTSSKPAPVEAAETAEGEEATVVAPVVEEPTGTPAFAGAPFILEVSASGVESLTNYLDILQFQDRLVSVVSVISSSTDGGETTATIYAYAFAGSNAQIELWENPPTEDAAEEEE